MECDIGSVLHKEVSPPSSVNTGQSLAAMFGPFLFYLKHIGYFPPRDNKSAGELLPPERTQQCGVQPIATRGLHVFNLLMEAAASSRLGHMLDFRNVSLK